MGAPAAGPGFWPLVGRGRDRGLKSLSWLLPADGSSPPVVGPLSLPFAKPLQQLVQRLDAEF
jgi:hypothetical protein